MRDRRDSDSEPGRAGLGPRPRLAGPSALAIAAGAAAVLPGFLVGALVLQIRGDLDASVPAVASGITVFFAAGALAAGPGGRLGERLGALPTIRGCLLVTAACLVAAAALAQTLATLLVLLAVAGVANAVTQPAINLFMADQVPLERQGLAFGIKQAAIPAAVLVSGLALPLVALPFGWRPTFHLCAAGTLAVAAVVGGSARRFVQAPQRPAAPRPTRALIVTALGAALASAGPNSLGAYLVASAVDIGIAEGTAGVLAAVGSAVSLLARVAFGERADRRHAYGFGAVIALLGLGSLGFLLLASDAKPLFGVGTLVAFTLGWGWPGLFNLAVVDHNRHAPGAATGITQTGIYVGAAGGPALFGLLQDELGYSATWLVSGALCLLGALAFAWAARLRG